MHLQIRTHVEQSLPTVWAGFNRSLFDQLSPPFPPVRVLRFDGCQRGDQVHLALNLLITRQNWVSLITDQQTTDAEIYFIDEGTRLPFFLSYWRHRHRLLRNGNETIIVDDITYRTPFRLTDYLLYPFLWAQFAYRQPVYRRIFRR